MYLAYLLLRIKLLNNIVCLSSFVKVDPIVMRGVRPNKINLRVRSAFGFCHRDTDGQNLKKRYNKSSMELLIVKSVVSLVGFEPTTLWLICLNFCYRFTQGDEDVVRHCFRYTVPVLTSVIALQKERQLKQETQVGLSHFHWTFSTYHCPAESYHDWLSCNCIARHLCSILQRGRSRFTARSCSHQSSLAAPEQCLNSIKA